MTYWQEFSRNERYTCSSRHTIWVYSTYTSRSLCCEYEFLREPIRFTEGDDGDSMYTSIYLLWHVCWLFKFIVIEIEIEIWNCQILISSNRISNGIGCTVSLNLIFLWYSMSTLALALLRLTYNYTLIRPAEFNSWCNHPSPIWRVASKTMGTCRVEGSVKA